ncbi:MAG: C25 family cysteine peptidase [Bacteroidales bacterium]
MSSNTSFSQKTISTKKSKQFSFHLNENNQEGFKAEQKTGSFKIIPQKTKSGEFSQIRTEGLMKIFGKGSPNLPVISKLIEIPIGADYEVEIISFDVEEIDLKEKGIENKIMPAQPSQSKNDKKQNKKFYFNEKIYDTNKFIGDKLVKIEDRGTMRNVRYGRLQISPLKYNPVKNKLKIYTNIKFEVNFTNVNNAKEKQVKNEYTNPYFEQLHSRAINYQPSSSKNLIDDSPITYVIVADRMFEEQLQPFIDWKELKGYNVVEAYTDEIGTSKTDIKSYLEDLYNNPNPTAPSFVLFVGDVEQIPAWDGNEDNHVTDLYYCEYTGDFLPEVYYGRFSAQNTEQLQPQIDKTLEYEKYEMSEPDYLGNALLVSGHDDNYQDTHGNGAMWYAENYYYNEVNGINSSLFLQPADSDALHDSIIDNINNGVSYANYTAHCSPNGWSDPSFSVSDVDNLTNEGKYGLWVGNCCQSVKFDDDESFGEAALRAENKGAIGDIGGSNYTYWDEDYWWGIGSSTYFNSEPSYDETGTGVYDAMFHTKSNETDDPSAWYITQGQAVVGGNMAVEASTSDKKGYYWEIYHLMGDPSLTPYFGVPDTVTVKTTPSTLMAGMNSLTVYTEAYAYVALSFNDELLDAKRADKTGEVTLNFESLNNEGEADIVITAQNKQPYIGTITVLPSDQPFIKPDSISIDDATGNNNGEAEYGESISLDASLTNVSDAYEAFNVFDSLSVEDPYVSLADSLQDYGDIGPEEDSLIIGAFAFEVNDSIPDQHNIIFTMHITGEDSEEKEYTWKSNFNIQLNAPELEIGEINIDDEAGNNDSILDPGETADLIVEITNTGHADVAGVEAFMDTEASELTIDDDADGPYDINAGETQTLTFKVTADDSTPIGTLADIDIQATCENNYYKDETTKQVSIGEIPEYIISKEDTVSTCFGLFYDSGGPDREYSNNESDTITFEPASSGKVIKAEFLSFDVETNFDSLKIYNGTSTSDKLIDTYDNENKPGTIYADNKQGALTFEFYSDSSVTKDGWEAEISCVEINEVVFSITDGTNPVENAVVEFAESAIETDDQGEATFTLEPGEYEYTVSKAGYDQVNGTLEVSSDITENVTMQVSTYDITFELYEEDGTTPIDGEIAFNNATVKTSEGKYTFSDVEYELDKPFTADVEDEYYDTYEGTVDVNNHKTVEVTMEAILLDISVQVIDNNGKGIEEATVEIGDMSGNTDKNGEISFTDLKIGTYNCLIEKEGHTTYNEEITIEKDSTYNISIKKIYSIQFIISNTNGNLIEAAEINMDTVSNTTDSRGESVIELPAGEYKYTITAEGYDKHEDSIELTSNKSLEILIEEETNINDLSSEGLKVYPNPADDKVIIENTSGEIIGFEIMDVNGKVVQNDILKKNLNPVDISLHPTGIYLIRFSINNKIINYKLIIR